MLYRNNLIDYEARLGHSLYIATRNPEHGMTTQSAQRPEFVEQVHLTYLDNLRDSGVTNMFGARPFLQRAFPELDKEKSAKVLAYWMETFA